MNVAMRILLLLLILLLATTGTAAAHPGQPPAPHDLPEAWNWDPVILSGLILTGFAYARGLRSYWLRSESGRSTLRRRALAFSTGWLALFTALVSPLDTLSSALFSAHMAQHILLMQVAAPLLVLGLSPAILAWCVPRSWRFVLTRSHSFTGLQALWKLLSHPLVAWTLHVLALWVWHTPGLYQAALVNENLHALEHISFLGSGLLYWWSLLYTTRGEQLGVRLLSLFTMGLQSGLLGALLTFSPQTWYTGQSAAAASWGLTPLSDQQLAGVLMWMPAGLIYLAAALWALGAHLAEMERDDLAHSTAIESEP
ncbi:MAG: cytochrome c oxidase assembly protein [Chloroflexi bacterium]|nr:cytochrome c oxidase assembly protein [Chloroflexota bacterium]